MLRKPRIKPPTIIAGIIGAKISAIVVIARCKRLWFFLAAALTSSLLASPTPETAWNSL